MWVSLYASVRKRVRLSGPFVLFLALFSVLAALGPGEGRAQTEAPPTLADDAPPPRRGGATQPAPSGGDPIRVYVLTFTPGDHPFFKFGHNAILIHDETTRMLGRRDLVYNYGMFTFGDPALIPRFFLGRFLYWLEPHSKAGTIRGYQREGRGVIQQELDLTMPQKLELKRLLEENALDENKYYKYDYYRDNCSTRVRDMIDRVTGGAVREVSQGPARLTWREHTSRLTADLLYEYIGLNLVMGDLIDKPRTEWEESFIPMEFQSLLRKVTVVGDDGQPRPLVKEERVLVEAKKPPPLENPPTRWPYMLLFGALFGGVLALLGRAAAKSGAARKGYGALLALFGATWGFFGVFFLAAWAFTDHEVGYGNENVLLCVPWAYGLVGTGINVARNKAASQLRAEKLILLAVGSACFALVAKILPWFDQDNWLFLAFFLPFWAGAYYGSRELSRRWAIPAIEDAARPKPEPAPDAEGAKPKKKKKAKPKPEEAEAPPPAEAADAPSEVPERDEPAAEVPPSESKSKEPEGDAESPGA